MSVRNLVEVRDSGIHGKGVFAKAHIHKEQYIGFYTGKRAKRNGTYVLWVSDEEGKEFGVSGTSKLKYLNHSDNPNAEFDMQKLYAERDIKPGEEITFHYGEAFVEYLQTVAS